MTATAILSELEARGVGVEARNGKLRLSPAESIGPELIEAVRAHKPEILAALGAAPAPCGSLHCAGCCDIGEGQRLHPPKASAEWLAWHAKWEAAGRIQ